MKEYVVQVHDDGTKFWFLDGKYHREDGPAIEHADGAKAWYLNGKQHREDGPAIIHADGREEWWLDGERVTEDQFKIKTDPVKELTVAEIEQLLGHRVKIIK